MKKLLLVVLIGGFAVWVYRVPLDGHLPKLTGIKSSTIMKITSNAFTNNAPIPQRFTCVGDNINPELEFSGLPVETKSLALIVDDPDATTGTFTHWVVFNIKPDVKTIPEGAVTTEKVPGIQAKNGAGLRAYTGPCPPSGTHRYYFKLYALDSMLPQNEILDKNHLVEAMNRHILDETELLGKFSKQ